MSLPSNLTAGVTGQIHVTETGTTITGKGGMNLMRLLVMRSAFGLWCKTGMQPTRGVRILKLVQETTGLRTRDKAVLAQRLNELVAEAEQHVIRTNADDTQAGAL